MKHLLASFFTLAAAALAQPALIQPALAETIVVKMAKATSDGTGQSIGTVTISETDGGASFRLALHGLPPGPHGFHVHENANCGPTLLNGIRIPAGAAGGHLDPEHTEKHDGPQGEGHLGDLPVLEVAGDGEANQTLVAPRIKDANALKGHALVIHMGGDNYKDAPAPLGGGGGRLACGKIE